MGMKGQGRFSRRSPEEMVEPALQEQIATLYRQGWSLRRLRLFLHCGSRTVKLALERHGIVPRMEMEMVPTRSQIAERLERLHCDRLGGRRAAERVRLAHARGEVA